MHANNIELLMRRVEKYGLSPFSRYSGISKSYLCELAKGVKVRPSKESMNKICRTLADLKYAPGDMVINSRGECVEVIHVDTGLITTRGGDGDYFTDTLMATNLSGHFIVCKVGEK